MFIFRVQWLIIPPRSLRDMGVYSNHFKLPVSLIFIVVDPCRRELLLAIAVHQIHVIFRIISIHSYSLKKALARVICKSVVTDNFRFTMLEAFKGCSKFTLKHSFCLVLLFQDMLNSNTKPVTIEIINE